MKNLMYGLMLLFCFHLGYAQKTKPASTSKTTVVKTTKNNSVKLKKDGTPDKRYKANKKLKKDGTPDKRFKDNK